MKIWKWEQKNDQNETTNLQGAKKKEWSGQRMREVRAEDRHNETRRIATFISIKTAKTKKKIKADK